MIDYITKLRINQLNEEHEAEVEFREAQQKYIRLKLLQKEEIEIKKLISIIENAGFKHDFFNKFIITKSTTFKLFGCDLMINESANLKLPLSAMKLIVPQLIELLKEKTKEISEL